MAVERRVFRPWCSWIFHLRRLSRGQPAKNRAPRPRKRKPQKTKHFAETTNEESKLFLPNPISARTFVARPSRPPPPAASTPFDSQTRKESRMIFKRGKKSMVGVD